MKKFIVWSLGILFFCAYYTSAHAETSSLNLSIPNAPTAYGQDSIRTEDGLDCKNSIGGATNLEFGVTGIVDNHVGMFGSEDPDNPTSKDVGVYARIVIPLDAPKERINCNSLYQLELRKKRLEVLRLQEELEALKKLNKGNGAFEN
jgi:hypothetical protein